MLSVSHIAWQPDEEAAAAALLARFGVGHVDIAPGRYFPDPAATRAAAVDRVRRWWADRDLSIVGMQALLFGTEGLNLFDDGDGRMFGRLAALCRLGGDLGVQALTFGSPRQRIKGALPAAAAAASAVDFFGRLGDVAAGAGVTLCLEPNAPAYGGDFMTNTAQTAAVVRAVAHPAIRLQLDTGNMTLNAEPPQETIAAIAPLVGHIHLSEPMLRPLGTGETPHAEVAAALAVHLPGRIKTIEMVRSDAGLSAVEQALAFASQAYAND